MNVQGCHLYYAEGILVHNCSQALATLLGMYGGVFVQENPRQIAEQRQLEREQNMFLSPALYDPYGADIYVT